MDSRVFAKYLRRSGVKHPVGADFLYAAVIPAYDELAELPATLDALDAARKNVRFPVAVIVVGLTVQPLPNPVAVSVIVYVYVFPASASVYLILPKSAVPAAVSSILVCSGIGTPSAAVTVNVAFAPAGHAAPEISFIASSFASPSAS